MFQKGIKLCPLTDEEQEGLIVLNVLGKSPVANFKVLCRISDALSHTKERKLRCRRIKAQRPTSALSMFGLAVS